VSQDVCETCRTDGTQFEPSCLVNCVCRQASRAPADIAAVGPETTADLRMVPIRCAATLRSQRDTSAPTMARAAGCCVVLGKVCWFCHKPEQIRKDHRNLLAHTMSSIYTPQDMQEEQNQTEEDKRDNAYGYALWKHCCCFV
jgi:hypothetical protein